MFLSRRCATVLFGLTLLLMSVAVSAQVLNRDDRFRVEVDAVNVLVTVNDKSSGAFIKDLDRTRFRIFEDDVEQEITNFTKETNLPLTIALCVDTSSSVKLKLEFEKEAALDFLYTIMRPSDRALLAEFDTGVTLLQDYTSNPNDLVEEIRRLRAGGGTSLYDAIFLVTEQKLLFEPGRRTMVILSDGSDLTSTHTYQSALGMAQRAEIAIYALSTTRFGADIDHEGDNALKQLTDATGGMVYFPYSTSQLTQSFREIEEALRSQYNLAYVPKRKERDGSYRKIEVRVDTDDVNVRYRKGYYAYSLDDPVEATNPY